MVVHILDVLAFILAGMVTRHSHVVLQAQLRTLAGVLHGSAALLTELSRGTAASMHAVNGNTAALAANAASVLDPTAGVSQSAGRCYAASPCHHQTSQSTSDAMYAHSPHRHIRAT